MCSPRTDNEQPGSLHAVQCPSSRMQCVSSGMLRMRRARDACDGKNERMKRTAPMRLDQVPVNVQPSEPCTLGAYNAQARKRPLNMQWYGQLGPHVPSPSTHKRKQRENRSFEPINIGYTSPQRGGSQFLCFFSGGGLPTCFDAPWPSLGLYCHFSRRCGGGGWIGCIGRSESPVPMALRERERYPPPPGGLCFYRPPGAGG